MSIQSEAAEKALGFMGKAGEKLNLFGKLSGELGAKIGPGTTAGKLLDNAATAATIGTGALAIGGMLFGGGGDEHDAAAAAAGLTPAAVEVTGATADPNSPGFFGLAMGQTAGSSSADLASAGDVDHGLEVQKALTKVRNFLSAGTRSGVQGWRDAQGFCEAVLIVASADALVESEITRAENVNDG